MNVQSILSGKGTAVATIRSNAAIAEAVTLLAEGRIGALVVTDDDTTIAGIVSERDVVRALHEDNIAGLQAPVAEIMSRAVVTCSPSDGVDQLMQLMTDRRIRHLPVVDDQQQLGGIVSIGDVVKARLTALEQENRALTGYISGH